MGRCSLRVTSKLKVMESSGSLRGPTTVYLGTKRWVRACNRWRRIDAIRLLAAGENAFRLTALQVILIVLISLVGEGVAAPSAPGSTAATASGALGTRPY